MIFATSWIDKKFRAFKTKFLKMNENQQLNNAPDFTFQYIL